MQHLINVALDSTFHSHPWAAHGYQTFFSYGERGYVKIYGIMRVLFPDLPADLYSDWRLHPESFVSRILVPEAARLLIKDDLGLSDEGALDVLLRSRAFGIALHPDVDSEDH